MNPHINGLLQRLTMTKDEKRAYLKSHGWKRSDVRIFGILEERWVRVQHKTRNGEPRDREQRPLTLFSAWQSQQHQEAKGKK